MKRLSALLLTVVLILSLCACGEKSEVTQPETENISLETEAQTPVTEFEFGTTYGLSYNNETMGIGISLPSEFTVTSEDQLAELNGLDRTLMTTDLPAAMENTKRAYLFVAMNNAGTYMNVVAENLKLSGKTFITGKEYFELNNAEAVKDLEDMGATEITSTPSNITISGTLYDVEVMSYYLDDIACSETKIAFPAGNFMGVMTIKGDVDTIINRIYGL